MNKVTSLWLSHANGHDKLVAIGYKFGHWKQRFWPPLKDISKLLKVLLLGYQPHTCIRNYPARFIKLDLSEVFSTKPRFHRNEAGDQVRLFKFIVFTTIRLLHSNERGANKLIMKKTKQVCFIYFFYVYPFRLVLRRLDPVA